jgi:hypothetical protein
MAVYAHFIFKSRDLKKITLILKEVNSIYTRENLVFIIYNVTVN